MPRLTILCLITMLLFACGQNSNTSHNKQVTEGYVIFRIMGPNGDDSLAITQKIYFKNGNTRSEFIPSDGTSTLYIGNDIITLTNDTEAQMEYFYGGFIPMKAKGKYYKKESQREDNSVNDIINNVLYFPTINFTNEKKIIAGYECKKVIIEPKGSSDTTVLWYTDQITSVSYPGCVKDFGGIKGMIL